MVCQSVFPVQNVGENAEPPGLSTGSNLVPVEDKALGEGRGQKCCPTLRGEPVPIASKVGQD